MSSDRQKTSDRQTYPYGYRPISQPRVVAGQPQGLPERERLRAATRRQNLRTMKSYKVLLIGESNVGKSTLVGRLCDDRFVAESRQYTLGFDMFEKEVEVDGERVKIYIWDTVGTETFDSITTQYYRGGAGIILTYDISAVQSFNLLTKWMGYVQTHATADVSLMLLGSKLDLDHRREVSQEEGQKFADNHDITFFYEVSAKTGHNVKEAFEAFFKDVHRKAQGIGEVVATASQSNSSGKKCCS